MTDGELDLWLVSDLVAWSATKLGATKRIMFSRNCMAYVLLRKVSQGTRTQVPSRKRRPSMAQRLSVSSWPTVAEMPWTGVKRQVLFPDYVRATFLE